MELQVIKQRVNDLRLRATRTALFGGLAQLFALILLCGPSASWASNTPGYVDYPDGHGGSAGGSIVGGGEGATTGLLLAAASAGIFRRVGPDGEVYFSDRPAPDAESVSVRPASTVRLPPARPPVDTAETAGKGNGGQSVTPEYAQFSIVKPSHNQGVRANDGSVTVYLELQPPLMPGHTIELNIDGQDGEKIRAGDTLNFNLTNMSRGRHVVMARVVDEQGKEQIRTGPVAFYVLRVALGQRGRAQ